MVTIILIFVLATALTALAFYRNRRAYKMLCTDKNTPLKLTVGEIIWLVLCWIAVALMALFLLETAVGLWYDDDPQLSDVLLTFVFSFFIPLTWIVFGLYTFALIRAFARFTRADSKLLWGHALNAWLLFIIVLIGAQGGEKGGFDEMKENYGRHGQEMQALVGDIRYMFPDSVDVRLIFDWRGRVYDVTVSTADTDSILYQDGTCRADIMEGRHPEYLPPECIDSLYTRLKHVGCYGLKTDFGKENCVALRFARTTYGHYSYKFYALPRRYSELKILRSAPNICVISPSVICYRYIGSQRFHEL